MVESKKGNGQSGKKRSYRIIVFNSWLWHVGYDPLPSTQISLVQSSILSRIAQEINNGLFILKPQNFVSDQCYAEPIPGTHQIFSLPPEFAEIIGKDLDFYK